LREFTRHLATIDAGTQTEIDGSVRGGVEQVVAFILRVGHSEFVLDVLGERMNLEREVAALHGVQKVEADGEFVAETPVNGITQEFPGMAEDEIEGRHFGADATKVEEETVFFRDAVETPCVVGGLAIEAADVAHPLAAPRSGIEEGHDAEGTRYGVAERSAEEIAGDQDGTG
jgi:hypothetical protein